MTDGNRTVLMGPLGFNYPTDTYFHSPTTVGVITLVVAFATFVSYEVYRPRVHPKSPAFIADTLPILGSLGFVTRQW